MGVGLFVRSRWAPAIPTWPQIEEAARAKRWDALEGMLELWLSAHPHHGEGLVQLARLKLQRDRRAEAIKLLEDVPESSRSWPQAQMTLGEALITDRRAAEAEAVLRKLAARQPRILPPRQRLIYLLSLQQRTAEARDMLWQIERIEDDPRVLVDLVLALVVDQQDVRGFGPQLEEFVQRTPDDPFLRRAWGLALLYQGRATEAAPHLEAAADSLRNDPIGRFALAECEILLGKSPNVDEALGPQPQEPADAAAWWIYRGRLEEALGHTDKAVAALRHALELQPGGREVHFRLGQLLERLGKTAEAHQQLAAASAYGDRLRAVRREHEFVRKTGLPKDAALYQKLGQLCLDAGQIPEARAWFEFAVRLDSERPGLRARLDELRPLPDTEPVALDRPVRADSAYLGSIRSSGLARPAELVSASPDNHPRTVGTEIVPPFHFEDLSARAGIQYQYDSGASGRLFLADTMGGGVGLIDYDHDGWLDIYFVNGCSVPWDRKNPPRPNRLYRNLRDGTFQDVTAEAGVAGRGYGMGCTVGDFDNDGHDDLFVTGLKESILYRNRGNGTFEDVTGARV